MRFVPVSALKGENVVHRGEHMTNPGIAHPDYGMGADATMAEFTNVGFPAMPSQELDS